MSVPKHLTEAAAKLKLISILDTYWKDNLKSAELLGDGTWVRSKPPNKKSGVRSQEWLYRKAVAAVRQAEQSRHTAFEPHRAPDAKT